MEMMPETPPLDVERLIAEQDWTAVQAATEEWHAIEIADFMADADADVQVRLFRSMPPEKAADVFVELRSDDQLTLFQLLTDEELADALSRIATDDRTRVFELLPPEEAERGRSLLKPEDRYRLDQQLSYPPESAGRLMSLNFVAVRPEWTAARALAEVRARGLPARAVATVYVTDQDKKLLDAIELTCLVLADPDTPVRDAGTGNYIALSVDDDREEAARRMQRHDRIAIPVVEGDGRLAGVVTVDDAMDVAEQEATEDIHMQAGVTPLRAAYPYVRSWRLFQKRIPWLAALIFVYLGASGVISAFEEALSAEIVLAAFIPLLMGCGGNVGAQSGTLTVRALATGDLAGRRWFKALGKELVVGALLGLALAVLSGVVGYSRGGSDVGWVIGASMLIIVLTSNVFGMVLPMLLAKAGVDPAVAASPVITSFTDLSSLIVYLGLATYFLL